MNKVAGYVKIRIKLGKATSRNFCVEWDGNNVMGQEDMEMTSKWLKERWKNPCDIRKNGVQSVVVYDFLRPTGASKCVISYRNMKVWFFLAQTAPICSSLACTTHSELTVYTEVQMAPQVIEDTCWVNANGEILHFSTFILSCKPCKVFFTT